MIDGEPLPRLTAERVELRWLTEADAADLFHIFSDPEVTRYWSSPPFQSREQATALIADIHRRFEVGDLYEWGVALGKGGPVIGTATLSHIDRSNRRAEIGFALARDRWGKGYIGEALAALLDHAFDRLQLHRLEADVDPFNAASIRTLERLGFQREGYLRERWIIAGEVKDTVFFGLLAREWRERRASTSPPR